MKNPEIYKPYQIVGLVFLSMGLNVGGRVFADSFNLPLWLDSFGTFLTAYCLGPVCGAIVGVSGNILHGLINPISFIYSITSIFIAAIVGILSQRGWFETLLKTMSLSVLVTVVSTVLRKQGLKSGARSGSVSFSFAVISSAFSSRMRGTFIHENPRFGSESGG